MTVDGSGNIMLPFVGPVHIEDLSTLASQQLIHDRLADRFLNQSVVSVRISDPRPFYILDGVRASGS
jgi:protein involved in polysaccharide export with SLBB domain